jgi:hypothetical protein
MDELRRRAAGLAPNRYYVLVDGNGRGPACLSGGLTAEQLRGDLGPLEVLKKSIVTGYDNANPYPNYGDVIESLGAAIGKDLKGNYPYLEEFFGVVPPSVSIDEDAELAGPTP